MSASDLLGARLCAKHQPQHAEYLKTLRLGLRPQPRSANHASRITFHV